MPIVITGYNFYNQLEIGAPELRGLWDMTLIPGTQQADGTVSNAESASGTAAMILQSAKNQKACWEFLKWWTGAQAQADFGNGIEDILGPAGRYNTANLEAFDALPWSSAQAAQIKAQWKQVRETPEIPGSYYTSRNLDNAFRSVLFDDENERESLYYWNRETDQEIARKRVEFGIR